MYCSALELTLRPSFSDRLERKKATDRSIGLLVQAGAMRAWVLKERSVGGHDLNLHRMLKIDMDKYTALRRADYNWGLVRRSCGQLHRYGTHSDSKTPESCERASAVPPRF